MDQNLRTQLQYDAQKKSLAGAYVLWLVAGFFGFHRFYLGRIGTGVAQLLLLVGGFASGGLLWAVLALWWLVDALLIPGMTQRCNMNVLEKLSGNLPTVPA